MMMQFHHRHSKVKSVIIFKEHPMGEKHALGNAQISTHTKYWHKQSKNLKRKGYKEPAYSGVLVSFFFILLHSFVVQE